MAIEVFTLNKDKDDQITNHIEQNSGQFMEETYRNQDNFLAKIDNIKAFIRYQSKKKMLKISELERRAGLKPRAVFNLFSGASKNPSINLVIQVANALGCNIDEMLNYSPNSEDESELEPDNINLSLFIKILNEVSVLGAAYEIELDFESYIYCVESIYSKFESNPKSFNKNYVFKELSKKTLTAHNLSDNTEGKSMMGLNITHNILGKKQNKTNNTQTEIVEELEVEHV